MQKLVALFVVVLASVNVHAQAPEFWNRVSPTPSKTDRFLQAIVPQIAYDESINYQIGLNLYREAAELTDLYGTKGSQLCAPIAITHGFTYLKYAVGFANLATVPDVDSDGVSDTYRDKIRYYFQSCQTDKEVGTYYRQAVSCIRSFIENSGYQSYVYMVGAHAIESPNGVPLPTMQHVVNVDDVRTYVGHRLMVLAGIGWYTYDTATNSYTRQGGHFVNVYGYDYSHAWGDSQIILKVVNNWIDYEGRDRTAMYDDVTLTKLPQDGTYPAEVAYELQGPGFNFAQRAFLEDLFVALPIQ